MKKLFTLAALFILAQNFYAQSAVTACQKADGSINILFDYSKNCELIEAIKKDTLGKREIIGFYSGANNWSKTISFDASNALKATRMKGTEGKTAKFEVTIPNPKDYYRVDNVNDIKFVFNDGVQSPNDPWLAEGREHNESCSEFTILTASLATCVISSSQDLRADVTARIAPNPFSDITYLRFSNPDNNIYTLKLVNITGQTVRTIDHILTDNIEIKRDGLTKGIYFAVLSNTKGKFLTEKLIIE